MIQKTNTDGNQTTAVIATDKLRPTKKQQETLLFIRDFIGAHGYSPSYREIMQGCNYTSVATVALHVGSLIKRGHLRKRDRSARSLEVVAGDLPPDSLPINRLNETEEKWLVERVEKFFRSAEKNKTLSEAEIDQLYVLTGALKILGLDGAAYMYIRRLGEMKDQRSATQYSV